VRSNIYKKAKKFFGIGNSLFKRKTAFKTEKAISFSKFRQYIRQPKPKYKFFITFKKSYKFDYETNYYSEFGDHSIVGKK